MEKFDIIIIGGGPGGYLAGERAAQAGLNACVIEKRALGGVCLNEGCVPTKTLLNSAKLYDHATHGDRYGVTTEGAVINHSKVIDRKNMVVKQLVSGVAAKMKAHNVTVVNACAQICGKQDGLYCVKAGEQELQAKYLLIAAGSEAVVPPIPGVKEGLERGFVVTNREILDLREAPQNLCVIGGGVIGMELASYFSTIGVKVTVLEMLDKIAGPTDAEISNILKKNYQKKGVTFKLGCKVTGVGENTVTYEENGEEKTLETDLVLLSIGRRASTAGLGLETIGVETNRGAVVTDDHMRTNVENVYAAGDVNGKVMLAHTAYREAEVAINNIMGIEDVVNYDTIPSVIYTNPEVACCGLTLAAAQAKGINAREVNVSMRYSGRYLAEVAGGDGICKMVFDEERHTLIGIHMIGSYVSESIIGAAIFIDRQITVEEMKKIVFPHPTVCEVMREGLFM